jgi:hypothetical protein
MEFLAKIYLANFFSGAKNEKKGRFTGDGTGPAPRAGWAGRTVRPAHCGPCGGSPRFFPDSLLFNFLLWSENFKESLNKENAASRAFLFGLFIWPNWELRNPSHLAFFCTHAAAMVSPKSVELKQGAKEPSMEDEKRASSSYPWRSRGPPASIVEGMPRPELSHLATPSRRRMSLLLFEGRCASVA